MHYDLIIISNLKINWDIFKDFNYLVIDENHYLTDFYQTNNNLSFDTLIFSNLNSIKNIELLTDNGQVITNNVFQTNFDHLFAIGSINGSQKSIYDQIVIIYEFLKME